MLRQIALMTIPFGLLLLGVNPVWAHPGHGLTPAGQIHELIEPAHGSMGSVIMFGIVLFLAVLLLVKMFHNAKSLGEKPIVQL
jgi:hypothetical protein